MYNPDNLIIPKEPKFYEDQFRYVFGPDDTGHPPYDMTAPIGTAIPQPEPSVQKLCPFRKKTVFYQKDYTTHIEGEQVMVNLPRAEWMEEEFLPCIKTECMFYNPYAPGGPCCTK